MFVRTVRDHGGMTPPKACNNKWICRILVVFTIFFIYMYIYIFCIILVNLILYYITLFIYLSILFTCLFILLSDILATSTVRFYMYLYKFLL